MCLFCKAEYIKAYNELSESCPLTYSIKILAENILKYFSNFFKKKKKKKHMTVQISNLFSVKKNYTIHNIIYITRLLSTEFIQVLKVIRHFI